MDFIRETQVSFVNKAPGLVRLKLAEISNVIFYLVPTTVWYQQVLFNNCLLFTAVLSEMPAESWQPDRREVERRKDFRDSHLIMSIDPKGCEDVDDALSIRKLKNGRIELGGDIKILCSIKEYYA